MKRSPLLVIAVVLLGVAAVSVALLLRENFQLKVEAATQRGRASVPAPRAPAPVAASTGAKDAPARSIIESARQMMSDALADEQGSEKKLWIRVDPRDQEAATFAGEIVGVFKAAGWDVTQLDNEGMRFKPGLMFLVAAEENPPTYVIAAQKAVGAIGQELTTGRGYLSYYESKKRETPDWQGTKFLPDQTFVVLVGRRPDPKPATEGQ